MALRPICWVTMKPDEFLDDARLRKEILQHIMSGKYRITKHASEQQKHRKIDLRDTLYVLKTGVHEKAKTLLVDSVWKYAIKGKTEDFQEVRVIVAFSNELIIITVMDV